MKRISSHPFVLSLCLLLFLPAVAGAFSSSADKNKTGQSEAAGKAEEETRQAAEEAFKAKFMTLSESRMNWSDAKAFCRQQGGRLPRINNSDSWNGHGDVNIDGFGVRGAPWPSGFPHVYYWTGMEWSDDPSYSWIVYDKGGQVEIRVHRNHPSNALRVVCVFIRG